jgi:hypothetical protein
MKLHLASMQNMLDRYFFSGKVCGEEDVVNYS